MIRTLNYPLYPTAKQETALLNILATCQRLYNAALEQRIDAYRKQRKNLTEYAQQRDLAELRKHDAVFGQVATTILRSALSRLDRAYKAFYRRLKTGQKPGFPRFRNRERYNSFSFPCQPGTEVFRDNFVRIPAFGFTKFKKYRPLKGIPKEASIRRTAAGWTLAVVCDLGPAPGKVKVRTFTGIDVGLTHFASLADGTHVDNPRFYRKSEDIISYRSQRLEKKNKGSKSWLRAKCLLAKAHVRIKHQRLDFIRKLAKLLVTKYDLIAYENLDINALIRGNLAKSILDASWEIFTDCIKFKAEEAGTYAVGVSPKGTSQRCSRCAAVPVTKKTLADRIHFCGNCGLQLDRDHNAAINIQTLGLSAVHATFTGSLTEVTRVQ